MHGGCTSQNDGLGGVAQSDVALHLERLQRFEVVERPWQPAQLIPVEPESREGSGVADALWQRVDFVVAQRELFN
jgi:hypothetical protein